jgi:hypothetical protein
MMSSGTGCDTLGLNNMSEKADSIKEWEFLEDNRDLMVNANTPTKNILDTLPGYETSINTH